MDKVSLEPLMARATHSFDLATLYFLTDTALLPRSSTTHKSAFINCLRKISKVNENMETLAAKWRRVLLLVVPKSHARLTNCLLSYSQSVPLQFFKSIRSLSYTATFFVEFLFLLFAFCFHNEIFNFQFDCLFAFPLQLRFVYFHISDSPRSGIDSSAHTFVVYLSAAEFLASRFEYIQRRRQ